MSEDDDLDVEDEEPEPKFDRDLAARFRAAWAYAGIKEVSKLLGVSSRTLSRMRIAQAEIDEEARRLTVEHTHVPAWFLAHGFEPPPAAEDPDLAERTKALEAKVETLYRVLVTRVASDAVTVREQPGEGEGRSDAT